jgi:hypothetical protein
MPFVGTADGINCETMGGRYENLCVDACESSRFENFAVIISPVVLSDTGLTPAGARVHFMELSLIHAPSWQVLSPTLIALIDCMVYPKLYPRIVITLSPPMLADIGSVSLPKLPRTGAEYEKKASPLLNA